MSVYPALSALLQMKCIARPGEHTRLRELVGWESSAAGPAIDRTERFLNAKSTSSKLRGRGRHHKRHKKSHYHLTTEIDLLFNMNLVVQFHLPSHILVMLREMKFNCHISFLPQEILGTFTNRHRRHSHSLTSETGSHHWVKALPLFYVQCFG